jgi:flagellin
MTSNIANLSDARSRIEDADYSVETTNMAKAQILSQASTAMIAQANQAQQNVLSLLK